MKHLNHLSPKQNFIRLILVRTVSLSKPFGMFANWLLAGTAAILGAVIVNVEAVSKVLSALSLKWGLGLLVISMLAGVIAKYIGMTVCEGLNLAEEMYEELKNPEVIASILSVSDSLEDFKKELSSTFLLPLRGVIKSSFERGIQDPLSAEKRLVTGFCLQVYSLWLQGLLGAAGLLVLGLGIT